MRHYSPFHTLAAAQPYPALLFTANRADDIVHPCHSRKFTARLEDLGYRDVFYYETEEGGHGKTYSAAEQAMIIEVEYCPGDGFLRARVDPGDRDGRRRADEQRLEEVYDRGEEYLHHARCRMPGLEPRAAGATTGRGVRPSGRVAPLRRHQAPGAPAPASATRRPPPSRAA